VAPFPGADLAAQRRLNQLRSETLAATRRAELMTSQQVSTARTADPDTDATLRAQSPSQRHWSEFSGFPQASGKTPATDSQGRRIPFAN
jgi:hypothetical protein